MSLFWNRSEATLNSRDKPRLLVSLVHDVPKESARQAMTYVITSPCIGVKDGSCVDVCPVDCIHPAAGEPDYDRYDQLFINPDECIDCGACEPACPVSAIFEESAVPAQEREFIALNAAHFRSE